MSAKSDFSIHRLVLACVLVLALMLVAWSPRGQYRIFLIGDSTVADKPLVDNPERGWGQALRFFCDSNVVVYNYAVNGRSTKSFIAEGRWQTVCDALKPGDYVFIQFGHNDAKKEDSTRYAEPWTAYKQNLERFVGDSKKKGAVPILVTPVNRRNFDSTGAFIDKHGDYPRVMREVAKQENVGLIDLHEKSKQLFERLGPEATKKLFMWVPLGQYISVRQGKTDNTHFTKEGALTIAGLVVEGIRGLRLPIAEHIKSFPPDSLPGLGTIVGLDYYFNSEWKDTKEGKRIRFHYVWEDTAYSGFSELGSIVDALGANIATLPTSPTPEKLQPFGIYILVDPDTPQETQDPHFIDSAAITAIESWVQSGGVLALFGNDKNNMEFAHFNQLSERFGIHFNEDSYHRVVGKDFAMGTSEQLPPHPIFDRVRRIYLKEICSLRIQAPAEPVLTENGMVLMATARIGKGTVFAVGDPWLYNEYIDNRKLPDGYDNWAAGQNLFRWLLRQAWQEGKSPLGVHPGE